jgi:DNA-binding MarR family transcriptional regulator
METGIASERDCELWALLCQAFETIAKAREDELRPLGITRMQAAVLSILQKIEASAIPAELARWLFREPHTVAALLDRMEK